MAKQDGKGPEERKAEPLLRPPLKTGGAAPAPPRFRRHVCDGVAPSPASRHTGAPWENYPPKIAEAIRKIRREGMTEGELLQSVGLAEGPVTAEKLRALMGKAGELDSGDVVVATAILNLALSTNRRKGIEAALRKVQKDVKPGEIADAIRDALSTLEMDREAVEGK